MNKHIFSKKKSKKVGDVIQVLYKHYFNVNVLWGGTEKGLALLTWITHHVPYFSLPPLK